MNNFFGIDRIKGESDWEFCWRCIVAKIERKIDCDWQEIIDEFQLGCHIDTLRKSVNVGAFSAYKVAQFYEDKLLNLPKNEESSAEKEIENKKRQLQIERQMVKDERTNLNRLLRTEARWNAIVEMLEEKVDKYSYEPTEYMLTHKYAPTKAEACVLLSDWHIGSTSNNHWNVFNLEVARERINKLLDKTIEYCLLHKVNTIHVELLGDLVNGYLHVGNRIENEEDVISQIMTTSELISNFLNELANHIPSVKVYSSTGNHGRCSANLKESLNVENFERLIPWYLKARISNPKIELIKNEIDDNLIVIRFLNEVIYCVHGHLDKPNVIIENWSRMLKEFPTEAHLGHFHSYKEFDEYDMTVTVNGTLSGVDEFAKKIRKTSKPMQTLMIYNEEGESLAEEKALAEPKNIKQVGIFVKDVKGLI